MEIIMTAKWLLNLPETAAEAEMRGFKKSNILPDFSEDENTAWLEVRRLNGPRRRVVVAPGANPGTSLVCYYDDNTGKYTDCRIVPDTALGQG
jgi:hypothetical protein